MDVLAEVQGWIGAASILSQNTLKDYNESKSGSVPIGVGLIRFDPS
jgi:hypothetical protein